MEKSRGLGFKIVVHCDSCQPSDISSCPKIGGAYEINRRFSFVMRCLGQGPSSERRFCMDLPPSVTKKAHEKIQSGILLASKEIAEQLMKDAVNEELLRNSLEQDTANASDMAVSLDGTWQKRGYSSLFGVCSLIGVLSTKVVDVNVKSSYCKACEMWGKKRKTLQNLKNGKLSMERRVRQTMMVLPGKWKSTLPKKCFRDLWKNTEYGINITSVTAIPNRLKELLNRNLMEMTLRYRKRNVSVTYKNVWVPGYENVKKITRASVERIN